MGGSWKEQAVTGLAMGVGTPGIKFNLKFKFNSFKTTNVLDSTEKSFDLGWNRTRVPTLGSSQR